MSVFLRFSNYEKLCSQACKHSSPHTNSGIVTTALRVPNMFFGIRVLHCLKGGIRDFKEEWGRDSGLKACAGCGIPRITIGTYEISREFGSE